MSKGEDKTGKRGVDRRSLLLGAGAGAGGAALLVGGAAQRWHLNTRAGVGDTVAAWRDHAPRVFPLPHPSWRTTGWQARHPWFAAEVLPALQQAVRASLEKP